MKNFKKQATPPKKNGDNKAYETRTLSPAEEKAPWLLWVLRAPGVQAPWLWAVDGGREKMLDLKAEQIFSILCLLLKSCPYRAKPISLEAGSLWEGLLSAAVVCYTLRVGWKSGGREHKAILSMQRRLREKKIM